MIWFHLCRWLYKTNAFMGSFIQTGFCINYICPDSPLQVRNLTKGNWNVRVYEEILKVWPGIRNEYHYTHCSWISSDWKKMKYGDLVIGEINLNHYVKIVILLWVARILYHFCSCVGETTQATMSRNTWSMLRKRIPWDLMIKGGYALGTTHLSWYFCRFFVIQITPYRWLTWEP